MLRKWQLWGSKNLAYIDLHNMFDKVFYDILKDKTMIDILKPYLQLVKFVFLKSVMSDNLEGEVGGIYLWFNHVLFNTYIDTLKGHSNKYDL